MNNPARATTRRPLRLATLTMLTVSIAVTLTVLLHLALVSHFAHQQARKEAQLRLQQLSWQMRDSLNRITGTAMVTVRLLSELPQVRSYEKPEATRQVLESIQRAVADYAWIGVADAGGTVRVATGGDARRREGRCAALVPGRLAGRACDRLPSGPAARINCCRRRASLGASSTCRRRWRALMAPCMASSGCT